jgi:hypothetical protein
MSRYQPYGAAYAHLARRRREAARDPHTDAAKAAVFGAALRATVDDTPARPGGVVDLLTRRLLDLAGYARCQRCDVYGEPGGRCPAGHPLPDTGGEDDA